MGGRLLPGQIIGGIDPRDIPSLKGWKARAAVAEMKKEARKEAQHGMRLRQFINAVMSAKADLDRAIDGRDKMQNSLNAKRSLYETHRKNTIQSGIVHPDMQRLKFAIEDVLPESLANAETEIEAARLRLANAERRRDAAFAEAAAADEHEADPVEVEPDPVEPVEPVEAKRGPGRPPKVRT